MITTIGDVVIQWDSRLKEYFQESNQAEIILPERKKGAIVLSLNGYDICEEASIQRALKEGRSYTVKCKEPSFIIKDKESREPGEMRKFFSSGILLSFTPDALFQRRN